MTKYTPKTKPFKHQSRAVLRAVRQRNHAIFFEPRLGKSKAALDWVGILALKGEVHRVLILAPRIALDVWQQQLAQHFPYNYIAETFEEEWVDYRSGQWVPSQGQLKLPVQFFLAGREETMRANRQALISGKTKLYRPKADEVERWNPDAIVVDESHEYKRPGGRGAQDLWRMVQRLRKKRRTGLPYVLLLSGTPNAKGWRDLFAQFRIMDQTLLGTSASDFDEEYCVYGKGGRKYTVVKYQNLKRLQGIISEHSTACTAEQAGLAGKLFFQVLTCQLPQRARAKYDELAEEFATEIGGQLVTAKNQGVKRLRLLQITGGFLTDGTKIHHAKVDVAKDWLQHLFDQEENVIVYCRFTPEVERLTELAASCGFDTKRVDGTVKRRSDRAEAIRWFQGAKRKPKALVFQVQAGSRSIELTAAAEILFYSAPDGWVDFWQALNRVRGPNQKRPVRITTICASGTVDRSVLYGLRRKEDMHRLLMKDPRRFLTGGYK